ncbi:MAG: type IX secretion system membrane protein PorP/SprF [Bacteroidota bacterium]
MRSQKYLIVLMLFLSEGVVAQNARFSQMGSAPIQFNPALTGRFDGKVRLSGLYSSQETINAHMQHENISIDAKFGKYKSSGDEETAVSDVVSAKSKPLKEGKDEVFKKSRVYGYWGVGFNYYHYGDKKSPLDAAFYSASLARHFYNKSNKIFGFGVQATYAESKLDEIKGTEYDREISGGGFRYPFPGGPAGRQGTKNYVDFNGGAYYGMVTDAVMFELGGSMHHLFYPKNDPSGKDNETELRHTVTAHSILRLRLNNRWGIVQKNMYWQEGLYYRSRKLNGDSAEIVAFWSGLEFYKINPLSKYNVNFGFYTRSFRTMMPYLNINLGKMANIRYSYELPFNSKKFTAYTAKRSEVALILTYKRYTSPGTRFYKKLNFW